MSGIDEQFPTCALCRDNRSEKDGWRIYSKGIERCEGDILAWVFHRESVTRSLSEHGMIHLHEALHNKRPTPTPEEIVNDILYVECHGCGRVFRDEKTIDMLKHHIRNSWDKSRTWRGGEGLYVRP